MNYLVELKSKTFRVSDKEIKKTRITLFCWKHRFIKRFFIFNVASTPKIRSKRAAGEEDGKSGTNRRCMS